MIVFSREDLVFFKQAVRIKAIRTWDGLSLCFSLLRAKQFPLHTYFKISIFKLKPSGLSSKSLGGGCLTDFLPYGISWTPIFAIIGKWNYKKHCDFSSYMKFSLWILTNLFHWFRSWQVQQSPLIRSFAPLLLTYHGQEWFRFYWFSLCLDDLTGAESSVQISHHKFWYYLFLP